MLNDLKMDMLIGPNSSGEVSTAVGPNGGVPVIGFALWLTAAQEAALASAGVQR